MSHILPEGDGQISRLHNMALSKEIGERLCFYLASDCNDTPLEFLMLIKRFQGATGFLIRRAFHFNPSQNVT